jgi:hypothetical protein
LAQNPEKRKGRNYYMKKSFILLLAFLVVGALAFAAEPTVALTTAEFTGDASVTLGLDIDSQTMAFSNEANADLKIQFASAGDKSTAGDNIWGQLKIKTDGDPIALKIKAVKLSDYTGATWVAGDPFIGFKVIVDVAQLNFGTIAYLGIKQDHTYLDYTRKPEGAAGFYLVDTTKYYGQVLSTNTLLVPDNSVVSPSDLDAPYGVVLGITPAGIGNFTLDVRSVNAWSGNGPVAVGFGLRGKADITAVANLTAQFGVATHLDATTDNDIGFGGKLAYKVALGAPMFVEPRLAADITYNVAVAPAVSTVSYSAMAGVLLGWGDKSKLKMMFSPDKDQDWGYYPGIAAGVILYDLDASAVPSPSVGVNVSFFAGSIIPNLTANAVLEIQDVLATAMDMGFSANLKYGIVMDPMTVSPMFAIYYRNDAAAVGAEAQTDIYVKAGVEVAKIFPNTTWTVMYQSNDFVGGVGNVAASTRTLGALTTTLKIAF